MTAKKIVVPAIPLVLSGAFTVAVKGTLYSEVFPYTAAQPNFNHVDAPIRDVALAEAVKAYRRLTKHNPDRVVRLLERPLIEFMA